MSVAVDIPSIRICASHSRLISQETAILQFLWEKRYCFVQRWQAFLCHQATMSQIQRLHLIIVLLEYTSSKFLENCICPIIPNTPNPPIALNTTARQRMHASVWGQMREREITELQSSDLIFFFQTVSTYPQIELFLKTLLKRSIGGHIT